MIFFCNGKFVFTYDNVHQKCVILGAGQLLEHVLAHHGGREVDGVAEDVDGG